MNRILTASILALAGAALLLPTQTAQAQCNGASWFCAEVHLGGSIHVAPPPPRRSQVIVVQPAPPPPPVYVQQAPRPPVVVVQTVPQPAPVYVQQQPVAVAYAPPPPDTRRRTWGVHGHIGGMLSSDVQMAGATGAIRLRPNDSFFALDLGVGTYGGRDYNGLDRVEVPLTADALFFINPNDRVQVYGVAGLGVSFAHAEGFEDATGQFVDRDYAYFGGQFGAGVEWRVSRWFAINGDLRGFVRERMDDDTRPEFVEFDEFGRATGRETDTSGGVLLNLGATVYF